MSQMDENARKFAEMLLYVVNCINYYNRITSYNDCNNCGKKSECEYAPRLGETTRINCPLWEGEKKDESQNRIITVSVLWWRSTAFA